MMKRNNPDSKVHVANMGSTCVLSAPDGPHVGPMNLAIRKPRKQRTTINDIVFQQRLICSPGINSGIVALQVSVGFLRIFPSESVHISVEKLENSNPTTKYFESYTNENIGQTNIVINISDSQLNLACGWLMIPT